MTRQLILGTAGHIDHGKTALVAALTGIDTDRLPEEKARGITIDIGFANLTLDRFNIGIVDVPGHEKFVRNMLAGAAGIDLALLVVAADDSVMPQTREHLAILQLLGIQHGLIALTKCDLPDPTWIDLVEEEIREVVNHTFLENAPIVRTSARTGEGIDELKQTIEEVGGQIEDDEDDAPFRLAVDRAFLKEGLGTIVTGTVWSGSAKLGDELDWLPYQKSVRIRGLQTHNKPTEKITSGQRAAIQLAGVHHTEIHRGHELAQPNYLKPSKIITVNLHALVDAPLPVKHRACLRLHLGSGEVTAVLSLLRANTLEPGEKMEAQFFCEKPISSVNGQAFVIRSESPVYTLGGGVILNPNAMRIKRKHTESINRLHHLTSTDPKVRVKESLYFQGLNQLNHLDIARIAAVKPAEVSPLLRELTKEGDLVQLRASNENETPIHHEIIREITNRIITQVTRLHEQHPLQPFIPVQRLTRNFDYIEPQIFTALLTHLCEINQLKQIENGIALKDFTPNLSPNQQQLLETIPALICEGGFTPPDSTQLATTLKTTETDLQPILDLCVSSGELIHIAGKIFLHRKTHRTLLTMIQDQMNAKGELSVSEIRELLNTSRKFAIPICEHLDRINFTKRKGNTRIPGPNFNKTTQ